MVWPIWIAITAFFSVFAFLTHQCRRAETLAVILIGLGILQITKLLMSIPAIWIAETIIWLIVIITIISIRKTITIEIAAISILLFLATICIPMGRIAGENYALGSVALFFSDLFGASAVFLLGGASIVSFFKDNFGGNSGMGNHSGTGFLGRLISGGEK